MVNDESDKILKKKAIESSLFIVFGFGSSQFLRLLGNVVLTRLLAPELFGIVAIGTVFQLGLALFSDIGLGPCVIRSDRVHEEDFINTAWTLQVLRGVILAIALVICAYPVSRVYEQPILLQLLPVIAINSLVSGFSSTSLFLLNKELNQKKLVILELGVQLVSLIIMVIVAYLTGSVWSLIIRGLVSEIVKTLWSHKINEGIKNRFRLEKTSLSELLHFGMWIWMSTAVMFLAAQSDRLLLGKLFSITMFGVYNIALNFSELPKKVLEKLSNTVIYPLISKFNHLPADDLRAKIAKPRRLILLAMAVFVSIFSCFGDFIILFLYDDRYAAAAWILPLLAVGMWPLILIVTIDRVLMSIGKPQYLTLGNLLKFLYMISIVPLLFHLFGDIGTILGIVFNDIAVYIVINIALVREKFSLIKQDLVATLFLFLLIAIFLSLRMVFNLGFPGGLI